MVTRTILTVMLHLSSFKWAVRPSTHVMGFQQMSSARTSSEVRRRHLRQKNAPSPSIVESERPPAKSTVEARVANLINHPAVVWDTNSTFKSMHKKKLSRRHLPLFDPSKEGGGSGSTRDALFDEFASAVCHAGVVARKEVFETWSSALYIHDYFFGRGGGGSNNTDSNIHGPLRRVADIAAGHGLLAWALLLLDDEYRRMCSSASDMSPLTVFCLDVQMPKSAELIQSSMLEAFPHLERQFDYVEGRLEQLIPDTSCLLAGVHACGTLSDVLVSTAAEHGVSLALVPCCHSRKAKVLQACASRFAKEEYDAIINTKGKISDLANRMDSARIVALNNSGMEVHEASIPDLFTDKNRLIMASPGSIIESLSNQQIFDRSEQRKMIPSGQMPPLNTIDSGVSPTIIDSKPRFMKGFYVPCKDDNDSRTLVSHIAGRLAAERRKEVMHNRNHREMPQLDISLWLPENNVVDVTEEALVKVIESSNPCMRVTVNKVGDVYNDPKSGRRAQTFRIQYGVNGGVLSFEEANKAHKLLYEGIPVVFPGAECR